MAATKAPLPSKFGVLTLLGLLGEYCRSYYQSDEYSKCVTDDTCQKTNEDYLGCCDHFDYCNFYSTNLFFWLMFFLVFFLIGGSIAFCVWRVYRKRKTGRGDGEEYDEPSDTI